MLGCFFIMSKYTNFEKLFHDTSYKIQKIILIVNCNSKLKQFFKNIMFIEVDICKSPHQVML